MPSRLIANFAAFQLAWFACVMGGAADMPWIGIATVAVVSTYHLRVATRADREVLLLFVAAVVGATWDGLLAGFGWLVFPSGMFAEWIAPGWIIAMWVAFATTLNSSLSWLKGRWYLAAALGAVGGPLAYYAGSRLGGVVFPDPFVALAVIGAGWSFILPVLVAVAGRLDGVARIDTGADGVRRASEMDRV